jgi:hypothetical protein
MIIALFALAVAMILGGLLAAVLGWDIVLVERGWTMVIAGSITAASGALLLGITAAVSKLVKIQAELMRLHAGLNEPEPAQVPSSAELSVAALAGGLLGGASAGNAKEDEEQPTLPLFPGRDAPADDVEPAPVAERVEEAPEPIAPLGPRAYPEPQAAREPEPASDDGLSEAKVPGFLLAERYSEERYGGDAYPPVRPPELDEALYARDPAEEQGSDIVPEEPPAPVPATEEEHPDDLMVERRAETVFPAEERTDETAAEPDEPAPSETRAEELVADHPAEESGDEQRSALAIVGTYTSGDNTYVMFSNGSIEAQTPRGVFNFDSLDELKSFIASGGESPKGDQTA